MNAFIKKENYNFIRKRLHELNTTFKCCVDQNVINTCRLVTREVIFECFEHLSEDQRKLLDIEHIQDALTIHTYLECLEGYVYGMQIVGNTAIAKLFKKERKMKMPSSDMQQKPHVYLSWVDEAIRKLFIVYSFQGKLVGMACRMVPAKPKSRYICALCNHVGDETEVAFVSPICKTAHSEEGAYRSIGFSVCVDGTKCNERITSAEKLENILKEAGQIK